MPRAERRAAVITGRGAICALGDRAATFWEALLAGGAAIAPVRGFAAEDLAPNRVAEVCSPAIDDPDRAGALAVRAAREALDDAALAVPAAAGVCIGTTLGGMTIFEAWRGAPMAGLEHVPYY